MKLAKLLILSVALVAGGAGAAEISLDVSPLPAVVNESCRLSFTAAGAVAGEPDFAPLERLFDIVGRNRQTSIAFINGRRQQTTTWTLSAIPRRTGTLAIPAIAFGADRSPPRNIEVVAPSAAAAGDGAADIMLEVDVDTRTPYVQQQVIYTFRLLARVDLSSPRFSALETSGDAIIKPLGDGRQFLHKVNGVTYEAFEQRYAIFAQQSGPLRIAPLTLTTQIASRKRNFFDPFSQTMQTRRVVSDAVELDVRPVPASWPSGATWLPATRLRMHDEWSPDVTSADIGAPLARTVFLWAEGLIASQLPELGLAAPDGIKVYPDQPQASDQDTDAGFTAVKQQKFALIASSAGAAAFEAIELPWWNTLTDTLETARIPARAIEFLGAPATAEPLPADAAAPARPRHSQIR
ncbi:MAG: BatD family protein [Gammaproteobacteria bacterium]